MKNNYFLILPAAIFLSTSSLAQKSFEKRIKVIEPGIGLGLYKTEFTDKSVPNAATENDSAGALLFPLGFEYGVLNWLGCGVKFSYNHYIANDDSTAEREKARGLDFALFARAHALRTKRIDLFAGFDFGYSHFAYDANNYSDGRARAGGTYFGFNLNSRFYLGKVWGLRLFYNFDFYNYPNGNITDNTANTHPFSWKTKSFFLLGAGLVFKLR